MTAPDQAAALMRAHALLCAARHALDRLAGCSDRARPAAILEAAETAQLIVDEIGCPETGETTRAQTYRDILADILDRARDADTDPAARLHAIRSICQQALLIGG